MLICSCNTIGELVEFVTSLTVPYQFSISHIKEISPFTSKQVALTCNKITANIDKILKITPTLEAFDDFINLESDDLRKGSAKGRANPQGQDTELYVENFLKTHQILIVQFCDDSICGDSQLNKKYIFENSISSRTECVNEAAKFF